MTQLLRLFVDICLLRRGPQDVPASTWLLRAALVFNAALSTLLLIVDGTPPVQSVLTVLAALALLFGLAWGALTWRKHATRFTQTMTALLGADSVISILALPVVYWLTMGIAGNGVDPMAALLRVVLLFWSLAVMAHVMRHALQGAFALGMLFAVGYLAAQLMLLQLLFPRMG